MARAEGMKSVRVNVAEKWEQVKDAVPVRLLDANPKAERRARDG
ncbi:MAG: hypothetical protein PHQ80_01205 [Candidatus ainarchaeum sp.]|nr:hypothetical protein [Candidatus ainarchaeum sp.]MDD5095950.1 hypothetical protein [Candidatus ainarchaeum sp.]